MRYNIHDYRYENYMVYRIYKLFGFIPVAIPLFPVDGYDQGVKECNHLAWKMQGGHLTNK